MANDCLYSSALDFIAKLKRDDPLNWFVVEFGRPAKDAAELQAALRSGKAKE